jgi:hypothetical protein
MPLKQQPTDGLRLSPKAAARESFEVTSTSGVQKRYSLNAYSAWWSNTSGGGSTI